jgi:vacuolar-type H+-ATPase subunit F/Vma7
MVTPTRRMAVAVIGDEDLVNGMRLAGVRQCTLVSDERQAEREVREAVRQLLAPGQDPQIALIVILEEYAPYVEDTVVALREARKIVPVILPVPSRAGARHGDARAYYRDYIRRFIGFDIEI